MVDGDQLLQHQEHAKQERRGQYLRVGCQPYNQSRQGADQKVRLDQSVHRAQEGMVGVEVPAARDEQGISQGLGLVLEFEPAGRAGARAGRQDLRAARAQVVALGTVAGRVGFGGLEVELLDDRAVAAGDGGELLFRAVMVLGDEHRAFHVQPLAVLV